MCVCVYVCVQDASVRRGTDGLIRTTLSVKGHLPSFLCSLFPPSFPKHTRMLSLHGVFREKLIYDICWRRTELWPSPVAHGSASSAFLSMYCASGLRVGAVGRRGEQFWVDKEQNSQSLSSGMAPWMTGSAGSEVGREGSQT